MLAEQVQGRALLDGSAQGPARVLHERLSFWGGFDPHSGTIIDVHHPQHGISLTNAIVVMASGRGSSSASSVLAEAIRQGTAPAGFVLSEPDEILALGSIVGQELYGVAMPLLLLEPSIHGVIADGQPLAIRPGGVLDPS